MLKRFISFVIVVGFSVTSVFAAPPVQKSTQAISSNKPMINLYEAPGSSKVIAKVPLYSHMVPIFYKKGWAKVGLSSNGQVGWVNLKTYEKMRRELAQPNIRTIFISSTETDKNGKPTVNIVAYHNGKKLSDKEAQTFYKKMLRQQQQQAQAQRRYWQHFNRMMRFQQQEMDQMMQDDMWFGNDQPIVVMPGPVMVPAPKPHTPQSESKK